jgi:hypothetical protein
VGASPGDDTADEGRTGEDAGIGERAIITVPAAAISGQHIDFHGPAEYAKVESDIHKSIRRRESPNRRLFQSGGLGNMKGVQWTPILDRRLGLDVQNALCHWTGLAILKTATIQALLPFPMLILQNTAKSPESRSQMEHIFDYQLYMVNLAIHAAQKSRLARVLYPATKPGKKIGDEQGAPQ